MGCSGSHIKFNLCTFFILLSILSLTCGFYTKTKREVSVQNGIGNSINLDVNTKDQFKYRHEIEPSSDAFARIKRQTNRTRIATEMYDDQPVEEQEEGFWGKVARVCLNLLRRFLTWLNE